VAPLHSVAIALGSNLGDRVAHLEYAREALALELRDLRSSRWRETEPVGVEPQAAFLNGAIVARTTLSPRALLGRLLAIERARGRTRPRPAAPRTLDLDLVLFDDWIVNDPDLQVPHPRFRERGFVLGPLAEVADGWVDPVTGRTVGQLLAEFEARRSQCEG
jgi:2-amino-4-hydroxy-6-hydroxymethyldihydropteridine diphosphokinase